MLSHTCPKLLEQTLGDKHATTLPTKRDGDAGSAISYCVGSQCFRPRGFDVVSLNVPFVVAGPKATVSTCKSQNNALICVPLRCGPIAIPAPPPAARLGTLVAMPVQEVLTAGFPL